MQVVKNFIGPEDLKLVQSYIDGIKFNTKEDHDPLHDNLFNGGIEFDIHTRGEMPKNILEIFSKYSKGYYELVQSQEEKEYHPPMFSKHYIARYCVGSSSSIHNNESTKPEGTYGSYLIWKKANSGGKIIFPNLANDLDLDAGDLVFFKDTEENTRGISIVEDGCLYVSEAWMGRKGQLWMGNRVPYEEVDWEDWQIKGFYE
jgi:hypothetical protein